MRRLKLARAEISVFPAQLRLQLQPAKLGVAHRVTDDEALFDVGGVGDSGGEKIRRRGNFGELFGTFAEERAELHAIREGRRVAKLVGA